VATDSIHVSTASLEGGPATPGSLVSAFANFDARLATSTDQASGSPWPTTLGGATVTVRDSAGVARAAEISFASPDRIDYRVPDLAAIGLATVSISAGGAPIPGALNIVAVYPGLFKVNAEGLAVAQVARMRGGR